MDQALRDPHLGSHKLEVLWCLARELTHAVSSANWHSRLQLEGHDETAPPTISASGRGRCPRSRSCSVCCEGGSLPNAASVHLIVGFCRRWPRTTYPRAWMGQWLTERLGEPFVIENRPGAGSNVGTEAVVRARPDGYTLLLVPPGAAINATLYDNLNFNFIREIAPVAGIMRVPLVMMDQSISPGQDDL